MSRKVTINRAVTGSIHKPGASDAASITPGRVARRSTGVFGAGAATRPRAGWVEA